MLPRRQLVSLSFVLFAASMVLAQLPSSEQPQPKSPLAASLLAAQTSFEAQRDQLYAQLKAVADPQRRLELQRDLEQLKVRTELKFLQIQLENARQQGDAEAVAQLESMVDAAKALVGEAAQ